MGSRGCRSIQWHQGELSFGTLSPGSGCCAPRSQARCRPPPPGSIPNARGIPAALFFSASLSMQHPLLLRSTCWGPSPHHNRPHDLEDQQAQGSAGLEQPRMKVKVRPSPGKPSRAASTRLPGSQRWRGDTPCSSTDWAELGRAAQPQGMVLAFQLTLPEGRGTGTGVEQPVGPGGSAAPPWPWAGSHPPR